MSCRRLGATCALVESLAKLPVFWALKGKRVIVVGGSDAAAWKSELLVACGAQVHVYADELSDKGHQQGRRYLRLD